ncbi:adenylate kinase [Candidatus Parcubacteria bacterium]|nr:MAG: adenylate kinase [Candidatus Parcubacteria bacterium]
MQHKIVILGPQGSGKGTQAMILSNKLNIPALSMGQLMRDEVAAGTKLGEIVKKSVETGILAPDEVALEILLNRIAKSDCQNGFIIDGYPRNMAQYKVFAEKMTPTVVLLIEVPREESMERMLKRAKIEKRPDDDPKIMEERLNIYERETVPVLAEYEKQGLLKRVDGLGTVEQVAKRVAEAMGL